MGLESCTVCVTSAASQGRGLACMRLAGVLKERMCLS